MGKMVVVNIFSRENIKPSSPTIHYLQPFKLCLFDQLMAQSYNPLVLFYPKSTEANLDATQLSTNLKNSLSETLTLLYPLSGRIKDNLFVDRFDVGVPFLEAHVNWRMSEFLEDPKIESLNQFLPCPPFSQVSHNDVPLIACQVNIFSCGGIALGLCVFHRIVDGGTYSILLKVWSAINRGAKSSEFEYLRSNLTKASLMFPPRHDLSDSYARQRHELLVPEYTNITRRFAFDAKAVDTLRNKMAEGVGKSKPSRAQALSSFIWKHFMATSRATSSSPKPCLLRLTVDVRTRMVPRLDGLFGNFFLFADAVVNQDKDLELHELASLVTEAISDVSNQDLLKRIQGDDRFQAIYDRLYKLDVKNLDIFGISVWSNFGFEVSDFGVGEPVWVGVFGNAPTTGNCCILVESKWNKGFEAWFSLEETRMAVLEKDPGFLTYAIPNPKISIKPPMNLSRL